MFARHRGDVERVKFPHRLTRAQWELLISRFSTQYPRMGLP